jgi:hypothetical protein
MSLFIFVRRRLAKNKILILSCLTFILFIRIYNNVQSKNESIYENETSGNCSCLERRFPKAIIIGPKKTGTGALLKFIGAHPQVAARKQEMYFLDFQFNKGYEWYR